MRAYKDGDYKGVTNPKIGDILEYSVGDSGVWWGCEIKYVVDQEGVALLAPHLASEMFFSWEEVSFRVLLGKKQTLMDYLETKYSLQDDEKTQKVLWEMSKEGYFNKLIDDKNLFPF